MSTKKPKTKPGEYINLYWEEDPVCEYVAGHVTPEEFFASVAQFMGRGFPTDGSGFDAPEHIYIRRIFTDRTDVDSEVREFPRGRGTQAVTRANYVARRP